MFIVRFIFIELNLNMDLRSYEFMVFVYKMVNVILKNIDKIKSYNVIGLYYYNVIILFKLVCSYKYLNSSGALI